ncbi:hypothetical protein CAOG_03622 [Capsaspora owczarzaki ATCC 30864]|uniref:JmjC domain-containing protein n=1 Tax=Capsaspora owczarzaki (strain ATCC 30864) TaxID=595528 RepID=A0A0D2WPQ9_CAPO3|nr:hypothetical protein CAOG_03622 [Capsaspora owczarzaki ATCC 30864]KJE92708.1 hypothetical protein CAOG_003622 [Capsaspora owczarzaki ATCC 30864]|eukprot:XP_004363350.2 hypothetical protein CAOG_03622 [Capsaspora owczarzaki ATCC 30864]
MKPVAANSSSAAASAQAALKRQHQQAHRRNNTVFTSLSVLVAVAIAGLALVLFRSSTDNLESGSTDQQHQSTHQNDERLAAALRQAYLGTDNAESLFQLLAHPSQLESTRPGVPLENGVPGSVMLNFTVPVVHWQPSAPFARTIANHGLPVVLRHSVVDTWPARTSWTPSYLEGAIKRLRGIYRNDNNRFFGPYYDPSRALAQLGLTRPINPYADDVQMTSTEFFQIITKPIQAGQPAYYFSGESTKLGATVFRDTQPMQELFSLRPERSSVNVWLGPAGAVTPGHYDGYHNFFTQLRGRKRFVLFPPSDWDRVGVFPFLHPNHAQCRANLSSPDVALFPELHQATGLVVVLEPGDMLYLPPLWFHMVESLEMSFSVNVWTDSDETEVMERVFGVDLPHVLLETKQSSSAEPALRISLVIQRLLGELFAQSTGRNVASTSRAKAAHSFLDRLYNVRYKHLYDSKQLPAADYDWQTNPSSCSFAEKAAVERAQKLVSSNKAVSQFVNAQLQALLQLPSMSLELWLGNYVEFLAATAVGPANAGHFMRDIRDCIPWE